MFLYEINNTTRFDLADRLEVYAYKITNMSLLLNM
jgi:hypothetical protein